MTIKHAYTPDLTVENTDGIVYMGGNELDEDSVRWSRADQHIGVPHVERRTQQIWRNASLALAGDTLFLGNDVSAGAIGSHLLINSLEGDRSSLLLETRFDDAGTELPHSHSLGPRLNRVVFSANEIGEIVTSLFELPVSSFLTAFRYQYYFKTGSVAATSSVTMTLSKGSTPGGPVVFSLEMPASQWPANTEVVITLENGIQLSVGAPLHLTIESDNDFSLIGDIPNGGNFFAMDFQTFELQDVMDIPTGVHRFLSTLDGQLYLDNEGHPLMSGTQGSLSTAMLPAAFPPLSEPLPLGI